mgnify:FL=1
MAEFFLRKFSALNGTRPKQFSKEALESLINNVWTGNVRELENTIERAVVLSNTNIIHLDEVASVYLDKNTKKTTESEFSFSNQIQNKILTVEALVNNYVQFVLKLNNGVKEKTARDLNIDRKTLYRRLKEIGYE